MQLLADRRRSRCRSDQLAQLGLELGVLVAQREHLALGERDRVTAVRMRHRHVGDHVGVILEEVWDCRAGSRDGPSRPSIAASSSFVALRRAARQTPLAFEHALRGPGHRHRRVPSPATRSSARRRASAPERGAIEQAAPYAGDHRGAGAGAASERFAGAALADAQANVSAIDHLHVAGVHARGKARMALDAAGPRVVTGAASTSATTCTACGLPIDSTETCTRRTLDVQRVEDAAAAAANGTSSASKRGTPMSTVTLPSASRRGTMTPPAVSTRDLARVGEAALAHEDDEAARAVAALLDFAAVGVEDPVAKVDVRAACGRSTTSTWSQPTPKRRSARRATRAAASVERAAGGVDARRSRCRGPASW